MNKRQQARSETALQGLKVRLEAYRKATVLVGLTDEQKAAKIALTEKEIAALESKLGSIPKKF